MRVTLLQFDGFDWDAGNVQKAQKHGVSLGEIEDFFDQELLVLEDAHHSHAEKRFIAVGTSKNGRPLFAAFTMRTMKSETFIRVVSARYCHKKESEAYEKLKKNIQEKH